MPDPRSAFHSATLSTESSDDSTAKQVLHWIPGERRKQGWPRVTRQHVIIKDTEKGALSWQAAFSLAADTDKNGGIGLPNVLITGRTKV